MIVKIFQHVLLCLLWTIQIFSHETAAHINDEKNDGPALSVWFDEHGKLTPCGKVALALIQSAPKHGVNLKPFQNILNIKEDTAVDKAEAMMNKAILRYITEMTGGQAFQDFSAKHPALVAPKRAETILNAGKNIEKQCADLPSFLPDAPGYKRLQNALKIYRSYAKKAKKTGDPAFTLTQSLKKGSQNDDVVKVKKYLVFYEYLDESEAITDQFDDKMEDAVKKFQKCHSEESDGVIGSQSQKLFAWTATDHLNRIRLNLQRWRYLQYPLESRYIMVNIAGYHVDAVENHEITLSMKAVVGMPSRKTPLFKAPMTHFIFNPTWTVPDGIFYKDKLPRILSDPDYLERVGVFMKNADGTPFNPYEIDWHDKANRPALRYPPGPSNPLGKVKFEIKNKFTIYLHDTNEKGKFAFNKRAKSSGCVRLEKPFELVQWLDHGGKYQDLMEIEKATQNRTTSWHALSLPVPVYFVYFTTWVDDTGTIYFSDDPYHYDVRDLASFEKEEDHGSS